MSLSMMPNELLIMLLQPLPVNDLKSVRLTCRHLDLIATEYLIYSTTISPHPKSLNRLRRISRHPVFRHTIHSIEFCAEYYDSDINDAWSFSSKFQSFTTDCIRESSPVDDDEFQPRSLDRWEDHKTAFQLYYDEIAIQKQNSDEVLASLSVSLALLPNITSVRFTDVGRKLCDLNGIPETSYRLLRYSGVRSWPSGKYSLFRLFLHALSVAETRITSLTVAGEEYGPNEVIGHQIFLMSPTHLEHAKGVCSSLTKIDLRIGCFYADILENRLEVTLASIHVMLLAAGCLEELKLWFCAPQDRVRTYVNFEDVLCDAKFPSLRTVSLTGFIVEQQHFSGFVRRHRPTLKRLALENIVVDSNWELVRILNALRNTGELESFGLRSVTVRGPLMVTRVEWKVCWLAETFVLKGRDVPDLAVLDDLLTAKDVLERIGKA